MRFVIKNADVADLAAGVGIEGRVIKNHLALFIGIQDLYTLTVLYYRKNFTAFRSRSTIAFKIGLLQVAIDGRGGLLGSTFPRRACAFALRLHGTFKSFHVHAD